MNNKKSHEVQVMSELVGNIANYCGIMQVRKHFLLYIAGKGERMAAAGQVKSVFLWSLLCLVPHIVPGFCKGRVLDRLLHTCTRGLLKISGVTSCVSGVEYMAMLYSV